MLVATAAAYPNTESVIDGGSVPKTGTALTTGIPVPSWVVLSPVICGPARPLRSLSVRLTRLRGVPLLPLRLLGIVALLPLWLRVIPLLAL